MNFTSEVLSLETVAKSKPDGYTLAQIHTGVVRAQLTRPVEEVAPGCDIAGVHAQR